MDLFVISEVTILAGGVLALILSRRFALMRAAGSGLISIGSLLGLVAVIMTPVDHKSLLSWDYLEGLTISFSMDPLSAYFLAVIYLVCLLAAIYSYHYMDDEEKKVRTGASYFFFSVLAASMALVVVADNMLTFLMCWEIMSLSSFFLVIFNYERKENREAGFLYFVYSHVGAMFIFAAFGVLYYFTNDMGFTLSAEIPESMKLLIFVLAFIGLGSKAGVIPFHVWLPHAHPAAPSHISAVMSGVMIKVGVYGILRLYLVLAPSGATVGYIVLGAGLVSGVMGVVYALGQHDLKRLLAYHSVENIGIILMGLGLGMIGMATGNTLMAALGFAGGLLHALNHAIFKSLLFMGAGMVHHHAGTLAIDKLGGLMKRMKYTGVFFLTGSLAISGLPPFNGFVSELLVYLGGFKGLSGQGAPLALSIGAIVGLALIGGLALACFTKVVGVVFLGEPRSEAAANSRESGKSMIVAMGLAAALCLGIGLFPAFFIGMASDAAVSLGAAQSLPSIAVYSKIAGSITGHALVFIGIFFLVLGVRTLLYRGKPIGEMGTWGCGFTQPTVKMQYTSTSFASSILEFFRPFAPVEEHHKPIKGTIPSDSSYESHVQDLAEKHLDKIVRPVLFFFDKLRWIQHGDMHLYILYILVVMIALLFFV